MDREKELLENYENNGLEGLKKLKPTSEEIDKIVNKIDSKLKVLNMEQTLNVSKLLNYNLPIDYCVYYSKLMNLHIKPNLFKVESVEKVLRSLCSMDENSKTYIMKYQNIDSKYKNKIVPFAELEFGDLLCFDRDTNDIIYYNHEEDTIIKVADNWEQFGDMLYE